MRDYAHPNSLVDTGWLAAHSREPGVRLAEIVWSDSPLFGRPAYASGRLAGAVNISYGALTYKADNEVPPEWREPELNDRSRPIITAWKDAGFPNPVRRSPSNRGDTARAASRLADRR